MATLTKVSLVRNALIEATRVLVGSELSTVLQNQATVPSVLKDITGGNIPNYPFIVISNSSSSGIQGTKILGQFIDDNNKLNILTEHYLSFRVKAYGENSESILNDLKIKMNYGYVRWNMEKEAEASFQEFSDIEYAPIYLSERFVSCSEMVARLSIRTNYIPEEDLNLLGVIAEGSTSTVDGDIISSTIDVNLNE